MLEKNGKNQLDRKKTNEKRKRERKVFKNNAGKEGLLKIIKN